MKLLFEILAKGREIADAFKLELAAISIERHGKEETYITYGADKVYSIDSGPQADLIVDCISLLINQYKPEILLIGGTRLGKEVAPRIAQKYGVGCATAAVDFSLEQEMLVVKRFVLGADSSLPRGFYVNPK